MVKRWIGEAEICLEYVGHDGRSSVYRGSVTVPSGVMTLDEDYRATKRPIVWTFETLHVQVGNLAPDSPAAYDEAADRAVIYGAALFAENKSSPSAIERAAAIEEATCQHVKDGAYIVRRSKEPASGAGSARPSLTSRSAGSESREESSGACSSTGPSAANAASSLSDVVRLSFRLTQLAKDAEKLKETALFDDEANSVDDHQVAVQHFLSALAHLDLAHRCATLAALTLNKPT